MNLFDYMIIGVNAVLIAFFAVRLRPYVKWTRYMNRQRKENQHKGGGGK